MSRAILAWVVAAGAVLATSMLPAQAAELTAAPHPAHARVVHPRLYHSAYCGPCGCPLVTYVRHPVLESTYGLGFDPRNDDTTQPHYYHGAVRTYPRYLLEGGPIPPQCF